MRARVQTCGFSPCFLEGTVHTSTICIFGCLWPFVSQHVPPDVPPDSCVFLLNYQQAPRAKSQKKIVPGLRCADLSQKCALVHMSKIADLWILAAKKKMQVRTRHGTHLAFRAMLGHPIACTCVVFCEVCGSLLGLPRKLEWSLYSRRGRA